MGQVGRLNPAQSLTHSLLVSGFLEGITWERMAVFLSTVKIS